MDEKAIENRINTVISLLNERQKRLYLAAEAESYGWGGMGVISRIAKVDKNTLTAGKRDLENFRHLSEDGKTIVDSVEGPSIRGYERMRKEGGGRKSIEEKQPGIIEALLRLVDADTYGNPENPLSWTTKSTRKLADELKEEGFQVSHTKVKELLEDQGYTLQTNARLMQMGDSHIDRDDQFKHINETAMEYMNNGQPVISVDCKKKENVGEFANKGAEYAPKGSPRKVKDHDYYDPDKGKAIPYGAYDIAYNEGYVNVGISKDTAQFAVNSIEAWWNEMGSERYSDATSLYITADGGGSNGSRNRLWKISLQEFANKTGLSVEVSHFPPGTSKWNKIEHRLFSFITKNWRGRPLESLEVIVNLISATKTAKGLRVECGIDERQYETGIKVEQDAIDKLNIEYNEFHGEWNYKISPILDDIS